MLAIAVPRARHPFHEGASTGGLLDVVACNAGAGRGAENKRKPRDNIEGMVMLVLSRKKNESIVINNDITIVVVEIRGDKVRLGVEAPKEVPVHRREVYDSIRRHEMTDNTVGDQAVGDRTGGDRTGGERTINDHADADTNGAAD
jgi:carbon storage regulator